MRLGNISALMFRSPAVCAALAAAIGATATTAPAAFAASGPTIAVNRPCYVNRTSAPARMRVTGSGFAPGAEVSISGGTAFTHAQADATGSFQVTTAAPELNSVGPGTLRTTLVATQQSPAEPTTAKITVRSTNLAVALAPSSISARQIPRRRIRFSFSGFVPGRYIYGYWLRRHVVARARFGRARGPCGTLTRRALLFPGGHPHHRRYEVAFESSRHYERRAHPRVSGRLTILGL